MRVTQLQISFYCVKAVLTQAHCPKGGCKPGSYHCVRTKTFMALHWAVEDLKDITVEILPLLCLTVSIKQLVGGVCTSRRGGFWSPDFLHVVLEHIVQICKFVVIYRKDRERVVSNEKKRVCDFCTNDHAMLASSTPRNPAHVCVDDSWSGSRKLVLSDTCIPNNLFSSHLVKMAKKAAKKAAADAPVKAMKARKA